MPDYIDEELERMQEDNGSNPISSAINIDDPIKVFDLENVISVPSGSSLKEVIEVLNSKQIGCVTIVDAKENTIGIFTERDALRKVIGKVKDLEKETVDKYMTQNPESLSENDPIAYALNKMSDGGYRHVPITRNGKVKFMLSIRDIVDQISITYRKKVLNLPPNPKQEITQYGG